MKYKKTTLAVFFLILLIIGFGWFFVFSPKATIYLVSQNPSPFQPPQEHEKESPKNQISETEPQKPLSDPPKIIKAIYLTSWSATSENRINYLIELKKTTGVNAAVIDIKDFSGYIAYDIKIPEAEKYKTKEIRIKDINGLIKKLHNEGIYLIARITVFQDPILARARPDLAVKKIDPSSSSTLPVWLDRKGLAWIDPASKEAQDYNISIAKDAASRGFDEINFDYIRFPSDGDLSAMHFPFWDEKIPKSKIIKGFFENLRQKLPDNKLSADIFGLVTTNRDGLGIGQILEDVYRYFDYVCPMVYPSHYYKGTLGFENPAEHPYEVIKYSIDEALKRLIALNRLNTATSTDNASSSAADSNSGHPDARINAKLRPWLQDFDLGAQYDATMVKAEIKAVFDALGDNFSGFMMWNPSNVYTKEALL